MNRSQLAMRVEDLSKMYRLGLTHDGSLRELANRWTRKLFKRPEPEPITTDNAQLRENGHRAANREFWAVRDASFELNRGEVLGIIGHNGAGKSTLLKILSQVTRPTTGRAELYGTAASLLEVGTGFHPELTGRENVFLNGAILGMTRREVRLKFDEIVDFSGVERFIDTPVKRYSSGMKVRLGFAVAAHLEPEILIIDEVLAVGDVEFQRKCLGKMGAVVTKGRTVLFVSHNMQAIRQLCPRTLWISEGHIVRDGESPLGSRRIPPRNSPRGVRTGRSSIRRLPLCLRIQRSGSTGSKSSRTELLAPTWKMANRSSSASNMKSLRNHRDYTSTSNSTTRTEPFCSTVCTMVIQRISRLCHLGAIHLMLSFPLISSPQLDTKFTLEQQFTIPGICCLTHLPSLCHSVQVAK